MAEKVSIIIPIFNREHVLQEALDSVANQSHSDWECLLVDDGSTDDSVQVCKNQISKDHRFKLYHRKEFSQNKGPSACRNIGIDHATGSFIIFLDSDDYLGEDCLKDRIAVIEANPEKDAWVFKMQEFNEKGLGKVCNIYPEEHTNEKYLQMILKYRIPFSVTCPIWRKEVLKQLQGFDEHFVRLEDPDLHCRALMQGVKFHFDENTAADCFYRVDEDYKNRLFNESFRNLYLTSFQQFYHKYGQLCAGNKQYLSYLNHSILLIFKDYVFDKKISGLEYFHLFLKEGKAQKILSFKDRIFLHCIRFYQRLRLDTKKGTGYFKLRNATFKKLALSS